MPGSPRRLGARHRGMSGHRRIPSNPFTSIPFNILLPELAKESITFLAQEYYDAQHGWDNYHTLYRPLAHAWSVYDNYCIAPNETKTFGVRGDGGEFATPAPGTEVNAQVYALSCVTRGASESSATCPDRDSGLTRTASRLLADNPTETPVSQGNY